MSVHKGYKQTTQHIKKAAEAKVGKPLSEQHKLAIANGHKGKKRTQSEIEAIANGKRGKKLSEAHREAISKGGMGRIVTEETRRKCSESRKGSKCYLWKGGLTAIGNVVRHSLKYRMWRSDVFHRDEFTCQNCYRKGVELEAHHIKAFSVLLQQYDIKDTTQSDKCAELWDINNGVTLCIECHKQTDNYAIGKKGKK